MIRLIRKELLLLRIEEREMETKTGGLRVDDQAVEIQDTVGTTTRGEI